MNPEKKSSQIKSSIDMKTITKNKSTCTNSAVGESVIILKEKSIIKTGSLKLTLNECEEKKTHKTHKTHKSTFSLTSIDGFFLAIFPSIRPWVGPLFALIHIGFYCAIATLVKVVKIQQPEIECNHILMFRGLFQLFLLFPMAKYYNIPMVYAKGYMPSLIIRSLFGWANAFFIYQAYQTIPLGDASSIQSTSPVVVFLLSYCMLNESMDYIKWLAPILTILGTILIAKPGFLFATTNASSFDYSKHFLGVVCAFISAFATAGAIVFLRKLKECSTMTVVMWYSITCSVLSAIILTYNQTWMLDVRIKVFLYLALISVFGLLSQTFMTLSLKYEKASIISVLRSLSIVFNFIIDFVAFQREFTILPIIGSFLIILAVSILSLHDHFYKEPELKIQKMFDDTKINKLPDEMLLTYVKI